MVEVAEIFRIHGPEYLAKYGDRMPRAHLRAKRDIEQCRTPVLGGQGYVCTKCDERRYSYHSCKNRHCPKCGNDQAEKWLEEQKELLLPVTHFLVTFTLPEELRRVARSNQKTVYKTLFQASSEALQKLAWDERFVGGRLGMVGVLHTWTRALIYHPHVHYIVTGGALTESGEWKRSREDFLVPVRALSVIFRAKFRDLLKNTELFDQVDARVWKKQWVVHSEPVGTGEAAFKYLAPYIFRVAISNSRIVKLEDGRVTFKYKDSATDQVRYATVSAEEFMRRFLQHVLPERFVKVRYYGLLSPGNRHLLKRAREALGSRASGSTACIEDGVTNQRELPRCPSCGSEMTLIGTLSARRWEPP
ncbi:MAG: IS91 family transposase [Acidobacteria bacterium]|nr:MAG: IS91 family transposase [Acidobacteriota bacterium]